MAIQSQPTRIPEPFAGSGTKNVIPATNTAPSASQAASWAAGFPPECSQPISAGGCPVPRNDVNGALNQISQGYAFAQDGGVWSWSALADYDLQRLVRGSDGLLYYAKAQSGPGTAAGAKDPVSDTARTYWNVVPTDDSSLVHRTGDEDISGFKVFEYPTTVKTTSGVQIQAHFVSERDQSVDEFFIPIQAEDRSRTRLFFIRVYPKGSSTVAGGVSSCFQMYSCLNGNLTSGVVIGQDLNGVDFAAAPPTSTSRTYGPDILTRDWIPKDTRICLTAGGNVFSSTDLAHRNVADQQLALTGGSSLDNGAQIDLHGESQIASAGSFVIRAKDTANTVNLFGTPSGNLTWGGQPLQTSSDERLKTPMSAVPDEVLDAWEAVQWGQFQYLDAVARKGETARLHLGLIAQRVKAVFEDRGLDACAYGILCHEERDAEDVEETVVDVEAYIDEEGVEHPAVTHVEKHHMQDAVDMWTVRYTEALAMETACQRRRADRAEARLTALEERLATIETKLNA